MYFKIEHDSEAYNRIESIKKEIKEAKAAAAKLVSEVGGKRWLQGWDSFMGGITGIEFDTLPKGWKRVSSRDYPDIKVGYPKAIPANKEILDRIQGLPTVKTGEIADALEYEPQDIGRTFSLCPGVCFNTVPMLVSTVERAVYKPLPGMIEITESEYYRIKGQSQK